MQYIKSSETGKGYIDRIDFTKSFNRRKNISIMNSFKNIQDILDVQSGEQNPIVEYKRKSNKFELKMK